MVLPPQALTQYTHILFTTMREVRPLLNMWTAYGRGIKKELTNARWLSMKTELVDQPPLLLYFSLSVLKVREGKEAGEERE